MSFDENVLSVTTTAVFRLVASLNTKKSVQVVWSHMGWAFFASCTKSAKFWSRIREENCFDGVLCGRQAIIAERRHRGREGKIQVFVCSCLTTVVIDT